MSRWHAVMTAQVVSQSDVFTMRQCAASWQFLSVRAASTFRNTHRFILDHGNQRWLALGHRSAMLARAPSFWRWQWYSQNLNFWIFYQSTATPRHLLHICIPIMRNNNEEDETLLQWVCRLCVQSAVSIFRWRIWCSVFLCKGGSGCIQRDGALQENTPLCPFISYDMCSLLNNTQLWLLTFWWMDVRMMVFDVWVCVSAGFCHISACTRRLFKKSYLMWICWFHACMSAVARPLSSPCSSISSLHPSVSFLAVAAVSWRTPDFLIALYLQPGERERETETERQCVRERGGVFVAEEYRWQ